jgi:hypothetical protein
MSSFEQATSARQDCVCGRPSEGSCVLCGAGLCSRHSASSQLLLCREHLGSEYALDVQSVGVALHLIDQIALRAQSARARGHLPRIILGGGDHGLSLDAQRLRLADVWSWSTKGTRSRLGSDPVGEDNLSARRLRSMRQHERSDDIARLVGVLRATLEPLLTDEERRSIWRCQKNDHRVDPVIHTTCPIDGSQLNRIS